MAVLEYQIWVDYQTDKLYVWIENTVGATPQVKLVSGGLGDYQDMTNHSSGVGKIYSEQLDLRFVSTQKDYSIWFEDSLIEINLVSTFRVLKNPPEALAQKAGYLRRDQVLGIYPKELPIKNALNYGVINSSFLPIGIDDGTTIKTGNSTDPSNQFAYPLDITNTNATALTYVSGDASRYFLGVGILPASYNSLLVFNFIKTDVTTIGGSNGSITLTQVGSTIGTKTFLWNDGITTQNRTGLTFGNYSVTITEDIGGSGGRKNQVITLNITIAEPEPIPNLQAIISKTNVTSTGGNDGTAYVIVKTGSGNYTFLWDDGPTTQSRTGLVAGTYEVTITDEITGQTLILTATITEPAVITPDTPPEVTEVEPYFEIPKMQSLHFVKETVINDINSFADLDNQLICEQVNIGFEKELYLQKFRQSDTITIQLRSTSENVTCQLIDVDGNVVYTSIPTLKRNLINVPTTFNVKITSNLILSTGEGALQSRVYFDNVEQSPLIIGDNFEIISSTQGIVGIYTVVGLGYDELKAQEYVVINFEYTFQTEDIATIYYTENLVLFDIYEVDFEFGGIEYGIYYAKISAGTLGIVYNSEPISIKASHKKTQYVTWTNRDNAYNIDYTTGIIHKMRVDALFFNRVPAAIRDTLRNTNNSLSVLTSKPVRKIRFETIALPPYLHEKLSVVFEHDIIKIQGQEFVTDEGYEEPNYLERSYKANSSIVLEQVGWINNTYNGDDLKGVDEEDDLLIINEGFLKL